MFLQTPTPEPNILQQIDWRIITPIITFILGSIVTLIVAFGKDYLDRRRELNNTKKLFFIELAYNYGQPFIFLKVLEKEDFDSSNIDVLFTMISFSIYDAYVDRIASLKPKELNNIYSAYFLTRAVTDQVKDMTESAKKISKSEELDQVMSEWIKKLKVHIKRALKFTEDSLRQLPLGEEFTELLETIDISSLVEQLQQSGDFVPQFDLDSPNHQPQEESNRK